MNFIEGSVQAMLQEELTELIDQAETQLLQLSDTIAQLRTTLNDVIEENNRLRMKDNPWQPTHDSQEQPSQATDIEAGEMNSQQAPSARERLQQFYEDGIHICRDLYGSQRASDEECLFCQGILDGLSTAHHEDDE